MSAFDELHAAVRKAHALSLVTCGSSGEEFRGLNDGVQECFMWALSDLLRDAVNALDRLEPARWHEKGGAA